MLSCESRYSCAVGFDLSIPFSAILAGTFKGAGIIKNVPAKARIIANPQIKKAALRFFIAFPNVVWSHKFLAYQLSHEKSGHLAFCLCG